MTNHNQVEPPPEAHQPRGQKQIQLKPITIILFLMVNLFALVIVGWPLLQNRYNLPFNMPLDISAGVQASATFEIENTTLVDTPTPTSVTSFTETPEQPSPLSVISPETNLWEQGLIVLSLQEGLDTHLFAYQPLAGMEKTTAPLTRLTSGSWQDITPAISPGENQLAFASNRGGHWDIHLLDLLNGETTQVTNTPGYDASPSWSPDGLWMAYESYIEGNLEILIQPVDGSQEALQLTNHSAADFAPAWSPLGRQIAFISTRVGRNQVWLANLDESGEDRYTRLSGHLEASAAHPVWSPDGRYLAWAAVSRDGLHNIYVWDGSIPANVPREVGSGDWAVWSPDGQILLTIMQTADETYLTAYPFDRFGGVALPPILLPGESGGLVWAGVEPSGSIHVEEIPTPTPMWKMDADLDSERVDGRWNLATLQDVEAPFPQLHDLVDDSFQAFRAELARQVGWDLLATLEDAYIPLSSALSPGHSEDWLYTGRAFTFNTLPINAGWMAVVREDYGMVTYWRVFLRARFQDGSQGKPLHDLPWDFNARYSGKPVPYDQGGEIGAFVPGGFWVDMTQIAAAFGWERLPALSTWQGVYPAARFNELVKTDGLDWVSAMLEIYPSEVLLTLTPVPTPTPSPTRAPLWYKSPTPTSTIIDSLSMTPTPTQTLTDTETSTPLPTATVSLSPSATNTGTP